MDDFCQIHFGIKASRSVFKLVSLSPDLKSDVLTSYTSWFVIFLVLLHLWHCRIGNWNISLIWVSYIPSSLMVFSMKTGRFVTLYFQFHPSLDWYWFNCEINSTIFKPFGPLPLFASNLRHVLLIWQKKQFPVEQRSWHAKDCQMKL